MLHNMDTNDYVNLDERTEVGQSTTVVIESVSNQLH